MALHPNTKELIEKRKQNFQLPEVDPRITQSIIENYKTASQRFAQAGIEPTLPEGLITLPQDRRNYRRFFGAAYDPTADLEEAAAIRQSGFEQVAKMFPRIGIKVASEVLQMPGYLAGLASWASTGFDASEMGKMVNNKWIQAIQSAEQGIKDKAFGIFTRNSIKEGNLLQNIFSPAFWATEGADGIGFLLAFLVPGMAIRAIDVGSKAARLVGKGATFAGHIDDVLATGVNTLFESAAEAGEAYRDVLTRYTDKVDEQGNPIYTEEQAKQMAGQVAASTMQKNFGILLVSNALEQKWLFNGWAKAGRGMDAAQRRAQRSVLQRVFNKDFTKVLDDIAPLTRGARAGKLTKNLFQNVLREGFWEEGFQYVAPKMAEAQLTEEEDEKYSNHLLNTLDTYFSSLSDTEMQKSVFLGAFLGGGMGVIQTRRERAREERLLGGAEERKAAAWWQKALNIQAREASPGLHQLIKNNYIARLTSLKDIAQLNEETGEMEIDEAKLNEMGASFLQQTSMKALMAAAANMGNREGFESLKAMLDSNYMVPFFQVEGGLEVLKSHINSLAEIDKQQLEEAGVTVDVDTIKEDLLAKADRYSKIYNRITDTNPYNVKVTYDPKDKEIYSDFVDLVKHNKLSTEFMIDMHNDRINKLTEELNTYTTGGKPVNITSTTNVPGDQMVKELKDSLNSQKENLTPSDIEYINKQIDAINIHSKEIKQKQKEAADLYNPDYLQKRYSEVVAYNKETNKAADDQGSTVKKDLSSRTLPDNLKGLYNTAVDIEEIKTPKANYSVHHSAELTITYKDNQGRDITHKGLLNERAPDTTRENLEFVVTEEQFYDEQGILQTQKPTARLLSTIDENTFTHRGNAYPIDLNNDVKITKTVKDIRDSLKEEAILSTVDKLVNEEKKKIKNIDEKIIKSAEYIDYLIDQSTRLQEKELESLQKTGTILTAAKKNRVQLVKVLRSNGNTVHKMYLNLDQIQKEAENVQARLAELTEHANEVKQKIEMLQNEREKLRKLGDRAIPFFDKSIGHLSTLSISISNSITASQDKMASTQDYINQLKKVLSGYFTTAANILGIADQVEYIRNTEEMPADEKENTILGIITDRLKALEELSKNDQTVLGAGKVLTPTQQQLTGINERDVLETLEQIGDLPANIEHLTNLIDEQRALIEQEKAAIEARQIESEVLKQLADVKLKILNNFNQDYLAVLKNKGILKKKYPDGIKPTPEGLIMRLREGENEYVAEWEAEALHPYVGLNSWFTSQSNQAYIDVNDERANLNEYKDVARWHIFVNNYAYKRDQYRIRSMTFNQVGQLDSNDILRRRLKFFEKNREDGSSIFKTYDELVDKYKGNIPTDTLNDIKMIAYEGEKPLLVSDDGNLKPENNPFIVFTSFSLPSVVRESGYDRFSFKKITAAYINEHYDVEKLTDKQLKEAKDKVKELVDKDMAEFTKLREEMQKDSKTFYITSVNPGKKIVTDVESEVLTATGYTHPGQLNLYIPSVKNDASSYDDRTEFPISGTKYSLRNGFLYLAYQNRMELIKPKTLGQTEDVDNIFNLFRAVANNHPQSINILNYLKDVLYMSDLENPYSLSVENRFENNKPVLGTIKRISFGDSVITAEDLLDDEKSAAFKEFLQNKYWNFNRKNLGDKTFVEYRTVGEEVKTVDWTEKNGGYKGFLFSMKDNNTKGTINVSPQEKQSHIYKVQHPQYINQSINLSLKEPEAKPEAPVVPAAPVAIKTKASEFVNHSGGALGSDSAWDSIGREFGVTKHKHYWHGEKTPKGNTEITTAQLEEGWKHVLEANKILHRNPASYKSLLSRNWFQVKNADAVFAIGKLNTSKKHVEVNGGTGWAVQMAIDAGKPVYFFDQISKQWAKITSNNFDDLITLDAAPKLTKNFAGIGTRGINEAGKKAIRDVYEATFAVKTEGGLFNLKELLGTEVTTPTKEVTEKPASAGVHNLKDIFKVKEAAAATPKVAWEDIPDTDQMKQFCREKTTSEEEAKAMYEKATSLNNDELARTATKTDNYERENIEKSISWFKNKFPDFPIEVVEGLVDNRLWGQLSEGSKVLISSIAAEGTVFHESFHVFSQLFLTDNERKALYNESKEALNNPEATDSLLEEYLAEEFRMYMMAPGAYQFTTKTEVTKSWFEKLLDLVLRFLGIQRPEAAEHTLEERLNAFKRLSTEVFPKEGQLRTSRQSFDRVANLPDKDTYLAIRDINFMFFQSLFRNFDTDVLFDLDAPITQRKLYDTIKVAYMNRVANGMDTPGELYSSILNNWNSLIVEHKRLLKHYRIDLPITEQERRHYLNPQTEEVEEDDLVKDTYAYRESSEINVKDLIPGPVRMIIAGLPMCTRAEAGVSPTLTKYGTQSTIAFNNAITVLNDALAKSVSFEDMMSRITLLSKKYPHFSLLQSRLKYGSTNITKADFALRNAFFRAFAHAKNIPTYMNYSPDGKMFFSNAVVNNRRNLLQNQWITEGKRIANTDNSFIITDDLGNYLINVKKFKIAYNKLSSVEAAAGGLVMLEGLGIDLNIPQSELLNTDLIHNYLLRLNEQLSKFKDENPSLSDLYDGDVIRNQKELNDLVEYAVRYNYNDTDLMYFNQDGNPEYAVTLNSHVTNTVHAFNNSREETLPQVAHLQPFDGTTGSLFNTHSRWWGSMKQGGQLKIILLKGYTTFRGQGSDIRSALPGEYKAITFNALLHNVVPHLRAAERKIEHAFQMEESPKNVTDSMFKDMMKDYLKDELLTSFAYFANPTKYGDKISNYRDNIKQLRTFNFLYNDKYISKRLRNRPPSLEDFYFLNTNENTVHKDNLAILNGLVDTYLSSYSNYIDSVFGAYMKEMESLTFESLLEDNVIYDRQVEQPSGEIAHMYYPVGIDIELLEKYNIQPSYISGDISGTDINKLIKIALYNQFIGANEQLKLFLGDIAFYKDPVEFHKRVTGAVSTKYNTINGSDTNSLLEEMYPRFDGKQRTGSINQAVVKDIIVSNSDLSAIYPKYAEINITDAQSWITLDEYRDFIVRNEYWSEGREKTYQYEMQLFAKRAIAHPEWGLGITEEIFSSPVFAEHTGGEVPDVPMFNGEPINIEECEELPILKPQGFGFIPGQHGLNTIQYFKTSTAPIFPSALTDNSEMLQKVVSMIKNKQDVLTFKSAHKGSVLTDDLGNIQDLQNDEFISQPIRYDDIGIQLDVHGEVADNVTISTQRIWLEFSDTFALGNLLSEFSDMRETVNEYNDLVKKAVAQERYNLIKRLKIEKKENSDFYILPEENIEHFQQELKDVFENRLLPRNTMDAIELALQSKNKEFDIMIHSHKIEEVFTSMVRNSVISRKTSGDMLIQESGLLYEDKISTDAKDYKLKFYRKEGNQIKPMQVMIALPRSWMKWVDSIGGLDKLNKAIAEKNVKLLGKNFMNLLTGISNRIPAHGMNSLEAFEIVKFLPHYHGPKVILPPGITVKAGSDFDVDKLTTYLNSTVPMGENNRPVYLDYDPQKYTDYRTKRLHNKINEIGFKATLVPSRFKQLIKPTDTDTLKRLAEDSKKNRTLSIIEQAESESGISELTQWWFNIQKGTEFWASKMGIAQAVMHLIAHAKEQQYPLIMHPAVQFYFKDQEVAKGYYQAGFLNDNDGYKISDNFIELTSGFVDAVKDPFIFEVADNFTLKAFAALNRFGKNASVGLETITTFFSQNIIKDYLQIRRSNMAQHMIENQYNTSEFRKMFNNKRFTTLFRLNQAGWYEKAINGMAKKLGVDLTSVKDAPVSFGDTLFVDIRSWVNDELSDKKFEEYVNKEGKYGYRYFSKVQLKKLQKSQYLMPPWNSLSSSTKTSYNNNEAEYEEARKVDLLKANIQLLDNFLTYMEVGKTLNKVNRALRPDARTSYPKHLIEVKRRLDHRMDGIAPLFVEKPITDALETSILSEFNNSQKESINMFRWSSLLLQDESLSKYVDTMNTYFSGNKYSQDPNDNNKRAITLKSHLFTFLIIDSLNLTTEQLQEFYKSLFLDKDSVPMKLLEYKRKDIDNVAIDELEPVIESKISRLKAISPLHNVSTFNKRHDVQQADAIESELYTLWNEGNPEDSMFISRMLYHALSQGGLTGGSNTYLKFIPNRIFIDVAQRALEHFKSLEPEAKDILLNNFTQQFFRNNAHDTLIVPRSLFMARGLKAPKKSDDFVQNFSSIIPYYGDVEFFAENYYAEKPAPYYRKGLHPPTGIALYKQIESTEHFRLVTKLGDSVRFFEYYPKATTEDLAAISMLPQNRYERIASKASSINQQEPTEPQGEMEGTEFDEINQLFSETVQRDRKYRGGIKSVGSAESKGDNKYNEYLKKKPTVNQLLRTIANQSDNESYRDLASMLKSVTKIPLQLQSEKAELFKAWGQFTFERGYKNATIHYNDSLNTEDFENTILHEAVHAATVYGYINNPDFKGKVDRLYKHVMAQEGDVIAPITERINSPIELLSYGLVDIGAQKVLGRLPGTEPKITSLKDLIDLIIEYINNLFRGAADTTALQDLIVLAHPYMEELQGGIETPISHDELIMELYQEGYDITPIFSEGEILTWEDIPADQIVNNTKVKYFRDSRSAELAADAYSRIPNVKVLSSERPGAKEGRFVVRMTKVGPDISLSNVEKDIVAGKNIDELKKEGADLTFGQQEILTNFEKYFGDLDYLNEMEKMNFIKGFTLGEIELLCGF